MNFRTYSTFSLTACLSLAVGCNQPVQIGEPKPEQINVLTGMVSVQTLPGKTSGQAMVFRPEARARGANGLVPTGACTNGKHIWLLDSTDSSGAQSVGPRITLSAGATTFPMAPLRYDQFTTYQFENNLTFESDAVHAQWDGDSAGVSRAFDADAIELAPAPDVAEVTAKAGQPLTLIWTARGADSVEVTFLPAMNSPSQPINCSFVDQGSAMVPASIVDQLAGGDFDRVEVSRVKVTKTVWYQDRSVTLADGTAPVYGIVGVGVRGVTLPLKIERKRVFLTSREFTGDLKTAGGAATGLAGGDKLCQSAADTAGLGGAWKAWLSDSTVNAADRLADVGPWYLLDGRTKVFANRAAMLGGWPLDAINLTETGSSGDTAVWTGTGASGTRTSTTCSNWTTASPSVEGTGGWTLSDSAWTDYATHSCDRTWRLYCFEQ